MKDGRLYQQVEARPTLRDLFVEMRFTAVRVGEDNNPDYEALYLVGHDRRSDLYVLHLFDPYPVSSKPVPGIGKKEGENSIMFRFDYEGGPWYNKFTWHPGQKILDPPDHLQGKGPDRDLRRETAHTNPISATHFRMASERGVA